MRADKQTTKIIETLTTEKGNLKDQLGLLEDVLAELITQSLSTEIRTLVEKT